MSAATSDIPDRYRHINTTDASVEIISDKSRYVVALTSEPVFRRSRFSVAALGHPRAAFRDWLVEQPKTDDGLRQKSADRYKLPCLQLPSHIPPACFIRSTITQAGGQSMRTDSVVRLQHRISVD